MIRQEWYSDIGSQDCPVQSKVLPFTNLWYEIMHSEISVNDWFWPCRSFIIIFFNKGKTCQFSTCFHATWGNIESCRFIVSRQERNRKIYAANVRIWALCNMLRWIKLSNINLPISTSDNFEKLSGRGEWNFETKISNIGSLSITMTVTEKKLVFGCEIERCFGVEKTDYNYQTKLYWTTNIHVIRL